jgi:transposase-like protein
MERRKFTREFKLEAVRLIKERGVSYAQASQDLGVHVSQLREEHHQKSSSGLAVTSVIGMSAMNPTAVSLCTAPATPLRGKRRAQ